MLKQNFSGACKYYNTPALIIFFFKFMAEMQKAK